MNAIPLIIGMLTMLVGQMISSNYHPIYTSEKEFKRSKNIINVGLVLSIIGLIFIGITK